MSEIKEYDSQLPLFPVDSNFLLKVTSKKKLFNLCSLAPKDFTSEIDLVSKKIYLNENLSKERKILSVILGAYYSAALLNNSLIQSTDNDSIKRKKDFFYFHEMEGELYSKTAHLNSYIRHLFNINLGHKRLKINFNATLLFNLSSYLNTNNCYLPESISFNGGTIENGAYNSL